MAPVMTTRNLKLYLAEAFEGASAKWRKAKEKGRRGKGGSGGGKANRLVGLVQYTDVDEDKVVRLSRRKQLAGAAKIAAKAPMAIWMRIVTNSGSVVMMNAEQFESGGASDVAAATPHFS